MQRMRGELVRQALREDQIRQLESYRTELQNYIEELPTITFNHTLYVKFRYRKFSTIHRSLPLGSYCEYSNQRPS